MNRLVSNRVISIFFYFFIFFMCFTSTGSAFYNNFNLSIYILYLLLPLSFIYRSYFLQYLNSKMVFFLGLMLIVFFISSLISPIDEKVQVWGRFFGIIVSIFLGYLAYIFYQIKLISFQGVNYVLAWAGLVHVFILLYMWLTVPDPFYYNWVEGLYFFTNIRHLADLLSICYFSSLILFYITVNKSKYLYLLFSLLLLAAIFWSGSRAAYFGILMGWLFLICYQKLKKEYLINFLVSIALGIYLSTLFHVISPSLGFFKSFYRSVNGNVNSISSSRLDLYQQILEAYLLRPFWGYGGEAVRSLNIMQGEKQIGQAHNAVLQILIDYGFVGLLFSSVFFLFVIMRMIKKIELTQLFCLVIIINIIFAALLNGGAYYILTLALLSIFMGMACAKEK